MSEILGKLMEILYKRGYVEYHSSLYANVLKEYNLEVPGLRPAWASLKYFEASNYLRERSMTQEPEVLI